jgi:hypothetical protein
MSDAEMMTDRDGKTCRKSNMNFEDPADLCFKTDEIFT